MKRIHVAIGLLWITLVGCTTAIIDEVNVAELPPLTRTVVYDPEIQNIMFNHCGTCHTGAAANAGVELTTYSNTRFYAESGSLLRRVNDPINPMPPGGLLSARQRQIISKWAEDNFPEN